MSREFRVSWDIELTADDPTAAARDALAIMRDPDSMATVFEVFNLYGDRLARVDLSDEESELFHTGKHEIDAEAEEAIAAAIARNEPPF